jgi:hypothetical protein
MHAPSTPVTYHTPCDLSYTTSIGPPSPSPALQYLSPLSWSYGASFLRADAASLFRPTRESPSPPRQGYRCWITLVSRIAFVISDSLSAGSCKGAHRIEAQGGVNGNGEVGLLENAGLKVGACPTYQAKSCSIRIPYVSHVSSLDESNNALTIKTPRVLLRYARHGILNEVRGMCKRLGG